MVVISKVDGLRECEVFVLCNWWHNISNWLTWIFVVFWIGVNTKTNMYTILDKNIEIFCDFNN